jgi:HEAT repeat protein
MQQKVLMASNRHESVICHRHMDNALIFARHFAQLVWLFLRDPGSTYEQQTILGSLVEASKDGAVDLTLHDDGIRSNDVLVPADLTGAADLSKQMSRHGLAMISVDEGATPSDIFGVASILATMPVVGDGGAAADAKRLEIGVKTIRFAARPLDASELPPTPTPPPALRETTTMSALPDMELGEVFEDPLAEARSHATPRFTQAINMNTAMPTPPRGAGTGLFAQFAAPRTPTESVDDLLKHLDTTVDAGEITRLLGDLAIVAEDAAHDAKAPIVCRIMTRIAHREDEFEESEAKRALGLTLRRLAKPEVLRVVAMQLPSHLDDRDEYVAVLTRAGENGAEAMIEQLAAASHQRDRHIYFEVLLQLKAGVPSLLHMVKDKRWFVARNAAELLGEMQVQKAEPSLTELLRHDDERVRRTASNALMRLGTPRAMQAIEEALKGAEPQMRMEAATALVLRKDARATTTLIQALDAEKDTAVQVAFLNALGKMATPDAVQRLIKAAEPERSLFKKRSAESRVAATHALADAGSPEAVDALRALQSDKDSDVRAAATLSLGRLTRRASTSIRPVLS